MGQGKNSTKKGKWKQLSEHERYKIEGFCQAKMSSSEIASKLGRDRRTIEREIARGIVEQRDSLWREQRVYLADAGQRVHDENAANKGRGLKIGNDHELAKHIEDRIKNDKYSPGAVVGEIKAKGLNFRTSICTKTVYNYIDKNVFLGITNKDLPVKRKRKKRKYNRTRAVALNNRNGRSIDERPENVNNREQSGHWEMDCVVGSGRECLLVLTERQKREEIITKMAGKTQACVKQAIDRLERKHKSNFRKKFKSFTMDNGCEFLDIEALETSCLFPGQRRITVYYAHPYSAWERGSNENANKLIRRFIPKGADIGKFTNAEIKRIEHWMNNYPRKMFGYKSANDMKKIA